MMSHRSVNLHLWWRILALTLLVFESFGLNTDGILLLSFKYSVLSDPLSVLESWNSNDDTPCSWKGVTCAAQGLANTTSPRVSGLALQNSQLLGSIPANLGMIEHLQSLNLSNNSLNGSLPFSLFNATQLQFLDLSTNLISGELPETIGQLQNLQFLNLSDNALAGNVPNNLTSLTNLTAVSLKNNYFSGVLPNGFESVQVLDLSSNLVNGSLPPDFGGSSLRYLNISYNRLSGKIPPEFAQEIPGNATIDLSFNNLTGRIPDSEVFMKQESQSFSGNPDLCGERTNPCPIPSSPSSAPDNTSAPTSPPAIAAIPKTMNPTPDTMSPGSSQQNTQSGLRPATIIGIVLGDVAALGILALIFLYVYHLKKKKKAENALKNEANATRDNWSSSSSEQKRKVLFVFRIVLFVFGSSMHRSGATMAWNVFKFCTALRGLGSIMILLVLGVVGVTYYAVVLTTYGPALYEGGLDSLISVSILILFHCLLAMLLWSYFSVVLTDPGSVPPNWRPAIDEERGEADPLNGSEFINLPADPTNQRIRFCRKCNQPKPPRCHHCSVCGRCVLKMDHHCVWVVNCVGALNYKYFLLFLFYTFLETSLVTLSLLPHFIAFFSDGEIPGTPSTLATTFLAFVLNLAFALSVLGFLIMHVSLVSANTTTIEAYEKKTSPKWRYDLGRKRNFEQVFGTDQRYWFIPSYSEEDIRRMPALQGLEYPSKPDFDSQEF